MIEVHLYPVYSKIKCDKCLVKDIYEALVEHYYYWKEDSSRKDAYKFYTSNVRPYSKQPLVSDSLEFRTGYYQSIVKFLRDIEIEVQILDHRNIEMPDPDYCERVLNRMPLTLRDYQTEALFKCLTQERVIVQIATGGGKGAILSADIECWQKKTLVPVTSIDLVEQLKQEFMDYTGSTDKDVGIIQGQRCDIKDVTFASLATIVSSIKKKSKKSEKILNFLKEVEMIVIDECHHVQAESYQILIDSCPKASIVHGYTATPQSSEFRVHDTTNGKVNDHSEEVNLDILLRGFIGPIGVKVTCRDLVKLGYLAEPIIYMIENKLDKPDNMGSYDYEYLSTIIDNDELNKSTAKIVEHLYRSHQQAIIFVTRIEHGRQLKRNLISLNIPEDQIGYVTGESKDRKDSISEFKEGDLPILIGTVLSEGLNFFCDAGFDISRGKSSKNVRQRLGRVLRKKKTASGDVDTTQPLKVIYIDYYDTGHPIFYKQARRRLQTYQADGHTVIRIKLEDFLTQDLQIST